MYNIYFGDIYKMLLFLSFNCVYLDEYRLLDGNTIGLLNHRIQNQYHATILFYQLLNYICIHNFTLLGFSTFRQMRFPKHNLGHHSQSKHYHYTFLFQEAENIYDSLYLQPMPVF